MEENKLLTIDEIVQNSSQFIQRFNLIKGEHSEEIIFRPLEQTDLSALQIFLENLSEITRRFATYPSYDLQCAQQFCDDIDQYKIFRMIATVGPNQIIAVFEFNFNLEQFDIDRYRKYAVELNDETDVQFAPCIADEYQNRNLGSQLLRLSIDLVKRLGKKRMILWAGVLTDNQQAIRFYEKNHFHVFREKYIAQDGYDCYDAILQLT